MNKTLKESREMKESGIEWIGQIPKTWEVIPNKYVMKKIKDICIRYDNEDILSLTMNGVIIRDLDNPTGKMPTTFDGYQRLSKGNLLMCLFDIDVTPRCIGLINNNGLTSPAYSQFTLKNGNIAKYYYYYYLNLDFTKELLHLSKRNSLTENLLGAVKVPRPPIHEQQAIANYLDEQVGKIDELITEQRIAIEKWKEYKQSLITETVTKGLNPDVEMKDSGIEWVGEIPSNWETVFINQLFTQLKNKNTEMQETNLLSLSYGKIVRKNIETKEGLLPENFNGYNVINAGDIVLRLTDLQNDQRSLRCGIAKERGIITSAYVTLRNIKPLVNNYYYYLIHAYDIMKVFYGMGSGVRQGLTFDGLKKMRLLVPSIENQQQIADFLDEKCSKIDQTIEQKQVLIQQLEEYKQSLIYECVTGKRCVEER